MLAAQNLLGFSGLPGDEAFYPNLFLMVLSTFLPKFFKVL
jgi:hypothetical protein